MLGRRHILALICTAAAAAGSAAAYAATATNLTPAGWKALSALNAMNVPTVPSCKALARGTSDTEAGGIAGICLNAAETTLWDERMATQCQSPATEGACGSDYAGLIADYKATAAWAGWFTGALAAGGCHDYFAAIDQADAALARDAAPFAADLRAHRRGAGPLADLNRMIKQAAAIQSDLQQRSGTLALDLGACKPPLG